MLGSQRALPKVEEGVPSQEVSKDEGHEIPNHDRSFGLGSGMVIGVGG